MSLNLLWFAFVSQSAFVQWHRHWGRHFLELTEAGFEIVSPAGEPKTYSPMHERAVAEAYRHLTLADRWGLFDVVEIKNGLAWLHFCRGEPEQAVAILRETYNDQPDQPAVFGNYVDILWRLGHNEQAIKLTENWFKRHRPHFEDRFAYAVRLEQIGETSRAIEQFTRCTLDFPDQPAGWYKLGGLLGRSSRFAEAVDALRRAVRLAPKDIDARIELAIAQAGAGSIQDAVETLQAAAAINPDDPRPGRYLERLRADLTQPARRNRN